MAQRGVKAAKPTPDEAAKPSHDRRAIKSAKPSSPTLSTANQKAKGVAGGRAAKAVEGSVAKPRKATAGGRAAKAVEGSVAKPRKSGLAGPTTENDVGLSPARRYRFALTAFTASLEALLELIGTIAPQAAELDDVTSSLERLMQQQQETVADESKPAIATLGAHVALVVLRQIVANQPQLLTDLEERLSLHAADETADERRASEKTIAAIKGDIEGPTLDGLPTDLEFNQAAQELIRGMSKVFTRRSRQSVLLRSLLAAGVESFEAVLAATLESYYWTYPDAVGTDREEFSLNDLRGFDSIDDAIGIAISARVDALLRETWDDWNKFFKSNLKFELADVSHDAVLLQEVFLRRNIVVHNNARVSKQYLRSPAATPGKKLGDLLEVDRDYLVNAVDELACAGVLLCVLTWGTAMKTELGAASEELAAITYEWMREGRWPVVKTLCEVGQNRLSPNNARRTFFVLNRWLAIKRIEGIEAVRSDLEAFDASALDPVYRAVKSALLDEEQAAGLAIRAFEEGRLTRRDLREWPVFDELRNRPEFAEVALKIDAASIPGSQTAPSSPPQTPSRELVN